MLEAQKFHCFPHTSICLSDEAVVFPEHRDSAVAVPLPVARVIGNCHSFKSMADHVQSLKRLPGIGSSLEIEAALRLAAEKSLLETQEAFLDRCRRVDNLADPAISAIGIATKARVAPLRACLLSYWENTRRYRHDLEFLILDDSPPFEADQNQRMLRELRSAYGIPLRYGGIEEKKSYARQLAEQSGVEPETVLFGVLGDESIEPRIGANQNALILDCVGSLFLKADDDSLCDTALPSPDTGIDFSSGLLTNNLRVFRDSEETLRMVPPREVDIIQANQSVLGKNMSRLLQDFGAKQLNLEHAGRWLLHSMTAGTFRVAATLMGNYGDSGAGSPSYCLALRGKERERILGSVEHYSQATTNRQIWRAVDRITIGDLGPSCAAAWGLDNRRPLPPFMPVLRGEDTNFGVALTSLSMGHHLAYLPCSVRHAPAEKRTDLQGILSGFESKFSFCALLGMCLRVFRAPAWRNSTDASFDELGSHLIALGEASPEDFRTFLTPYFLHRIAAELELGDRLLQDYGAQPDYWAADVIRLKQAFMDTLQRGAFLTVSDLRRKTDRGHESLSRAQKLIGFYGRLIRVWPRLFSAARALRSQGVRMTRGVA